MDLVRRPAAAIAVLDHGLPVPGDRLVDRQLGFVDVDGLSLVGQPFGDPPIVLGVAGERIVRAQVDVTPVERDDGLAGGLVATIFGNRRSQLRHVESPSFAKTVCTVLDSLENATLPIVGRYTKHL